ncbi:hypothetical protein VTK73DRAFT_6892 [Phialemonium thermophilum]|uniref:Uncharacterized protein n=1 Tax=Phialemonium thermophilum TaxID=223376 RepID=A0ABR3WHU7_9PEZI
MVARQSLPAPPSVQSPKPVLFPRGRLDGQELLPVRLPSSSSSSEGGQRNVTLLMSADFGPFTLGKGYETNLRFSSFVFRATSDHRRQHPSIRKDGRYMPAFFGNTASRACSYRIQPHHPPSARVTHVGFSFAAFSTCRTGARTHLRTPRCVSVHPWKSDAWQPTIVCVPRSLPLLSR